MRAATGWCRLRRTAPRGLVPRLGQHMSQQRASGRSDGAEKDLADAYQELQSLLLEQPDVTGYLQQVAVLAAEAVPADSCSVTLRRDHEVTTVASSGEFASRVDEIQYGRGQGPCLRSL